MKSVIGITGGIACGKSFICKNLIDLGYTLIDTDKISHDITEKDAIGIKKLEDSIFKECIKDGILDREKLSKIIFNSKEKKELLNSILHPLIYDLTLKEINKYKDGIIFVDIPLLFEAKFDRLVDKVICVYTDFNTQLQRLIKRDKIDKEYAIKKINSQLDLEEKKKRSDYLILSCEKRSDTLKNLYDVLSIIKEEHNAKSL